MDILSRLYSKTLSLEEYLVQIPGCPSPHHDADKSGYRSFLMNTRVGIPSWDTQPEPPVSFEHISSQKEVLMRVVKKLNKQNKGKDTNVLTLGWQASPRRMWKLDGPASLGTGHFLPGNTMSQLNMPYWKRLLGSLFLILFAQFLAHLQIYEIFLVHSHAYYRIGDDIMAHLLHDLAIFVKAPPSSYIQLTGTPVYALGKVEDIGKDEDFRSETSSTETKATLTTEKQAEDMLPNAGILEEQHDEEITIMSGIVTDPEETFTSIRTRVNADSIASTVNEDNVRIPQPEAQDISTGILDSVQGMKKRKRTSEGTSPCYRDGQKTKRTRTSEETSPCNRDGQKTKRTRTSEETSPCNRDGQKTKRTRTSEETSPCNRDGQKTKRTRTSEETSPCNSDGQKTKHTRTSEETSPCNSDGQKTKRTRTSEETSPCSRDGQKIKCRRKTERTEEDIHLYSKEKRKTKLRRKTKEKPEGKSHPSADLQKSKRRKDGVRYTTDYLKVDVCYSRGGKDKLPKMHPMEALSSNAKGARLLTGEIFKITSIKQDTARNNLEKKRPQTTPKRYLKVQELLHTMLKNHKKTSIKYLLKYHTESHKKPLTQERLDTREPLSAVCQRRAPDKIMQSQSADSTEDTTDLITMATPSWRVFLFIRAVLFRIVPHQLWGSMWNRSVFMKYVKRFLELGRHEKLSLHQLIKEIRIDDCDWVKLDTKYSAAAQTPSPSSIAKQHEMISDLLQWLMDNYVITLVKTFFYVTESSVSRNQLIYFRKPTWHKLENTAARKLQESGIARPITETVAIEMISSGRSLGCSALRFIPKTTSLRPIVNMGKSCRVSTQKKLLPVKILLQDLFDILTHIKNTQAHLLGSAVLGTDEIYPRWRKFVAKRKDTQRPLYFVKVDIAKCYESIQHEKLFAVMETLLESFSKQYVISRYVAVTIRRDKTGLHKAYNRLVSTDHADIHGMLVKMAKTDRKLKKAIIINKVSQHTETPASFLETLKKHVKGDIIKNGGQHYLRTSGISQGSPISSLLCSYLYAHMEKCCLAGLDQDGLLLHLVDDFLLVTPHLEKAKKFLDILLTGVPQYGCYANSNKTFINFSHEFQGSYIPRVADGELFPWCGLLIDTASLHVCNEYARYKDIPMRYTMTIDTSCSEVWSAMQSRLKQSLQTKDVRIFLDPVINSQEIMIMNAYHMLLMLGFRYHAYTRILPAIATRRHVALVLQLIEYYANFVHRKLEPLPLDYPLNKSAIMWLGLKAFKTKLSKHQTAYRELLKILGKHQHRAAKKLGHEMLAELILHSSPDMPQEFTVMT